MATSEAGKPTGPLWREAFDAVERPIAAFSEAWVQTDTFMDALAIGWRVRWRLRRELHRSAGAWLALWDVPSGRDVRQVVVQLAGLERQLRELARELEPPARPPRAASAKRRAG